MQAYAKLRPDVPELADLTSAAASDESMAQNGKGAKRQRIYEDHLPESEVTAGLKRGSLHQVCALQHLWLLQARKCSASANSTCLSPSSPLASSALLQASSGSASWRATCRSQMSQPASSAALCTSCAPTRKPSTCEGICIKVSLQQRIYEDHLPESEVTAGLKRGSLHQACLVLHAQGPSSICCCVRS